MFFQCLKESEENRSGLALSKDYISSKMFRLNDICQKQHQPLGHGYQLLTWPPKKDKAEKSHTLIELPWCRQNCCNTFIHVTKLIQGILSRISKMQNGFFMLEIPRISSHETSRCCESSKHNAQSLGALLSASLLHKQCPTSFLFLSISWMTFFSTSARLLSSSCIASSFSSNSYTGKAALVSLHLSTT